LPDCVAVFRRQDPEVHLSLREMSDQQVHAVVEAGTADFGVVLNRGANLDSPWAVSRWLEFEPLYELDVILITPQNHPLARQRRARPGDLLRYPLVNTFRSLPSPMVVAVLEQLGLTESPAPLVDTVFTASMRRYIALGAGIGLIAVPHARPRQAGFWEYDMSRYFGRPVVHLVRRKGTPLSPAATAFADLLKQHHARRG
jgi:DNA-binding transcriptional LysR family regulator